MLIASKLDDTFKHTLYLVLACLRHRLGVLSFNLMLTTPPLGGDKLGFPTLARVVDRGDPRITTCDIGAMELYAQNIVSSDPLKLAALLKEFVGNNSAGL